MPPGCCWLDLTNWMPKTCLCAQPYLACIRTSNLQLGQHNALHSLCVTVCLIPLMNGFNTAFNPPFPKFVHLHGVFNVTMPRSKLPLPCPGAMECLKAM